MGKHSLSCCDAEAMGNTCTLLTKALQSLKELLIVGERGQSGWMAKHDDLPDDGLDELCSL